MNLLLCALMVGVALVARRDIRIQQLALLAASWLFYLTWGWGFLAVLVASSLLNYALGLFLRRHLTLVRLWAGVGANIALLAFFKYGTAFLADESGSALFHYLIRPIGMSFWTLQALSYLFDLYHEEELDPSPIEFCLYVAFWPTVVMGPSTRLSALLPQLRHRLTPSGQDVSVGLMRVLCGAFMKMVVAEILGAGWTSGAGVNAGFDSNAGRVEWTGRLVPGDRFWFAAVFDFAGYSHIVVGAARVIGIRLDENFDHPFRALTPATFWTRWHMSLSFWFRDYVFLPLASWRRGRWWTYTSLLILMVAVGVWHQATATYIAWGAYHGMLLVGHRVGQQARRSLPLQWPSGLGRALSWTATFALVSIGWIFFRAASMTQASAMVRALAQPGSYRHLALPTGYYGMVAGLVIVCMLSSAAQLLFERWRERQSELDIALDFATARVWWWLAPAVMVIGLFGGLAVHDLRPSAPRTPFMYTLF